MTIKMKALQGYSKIVGWIGGIITFVGSNKFMQSYPIEEDKKATSFREASKILLKQMVIGEGIRHINDKPEAKP